MAKNQFLVIAHRGASAEAPENTIAAYKLSEKMGADYIEIDLQMTKDGELVAMHDSSVDRTTDGSGKVAELTLAEIKQLDAGSWFYEAFPKKENKAFEGVQVPTLQEVFKEFGSDANYYIETKKGDNAFEMERELIKLLSQYGLLDGSQNKGQVVIQSFHKESLKFIHKLNSDIPLIKLEYDEEIADMSKAELEDICEYAVGIGASYTKIDKGYIKKARAEGLLVHLFTIDNANDVKKVKSLGATGIFTNDVQPIKEALER
ncbi:glycerophosphodiester phosphodiesterase [Planococcus sp. YIM B11945]|uniref:glycerophosphodiester phosphodiesterase n=1 Tax=Planococcus sp. YIM B11945 TaxID=3435410 RepID=UPI003D7CE88F